MTRADALHYLAEARHYRNVGWRDSSAYYLRLAASARRSLAAEGKKL